LLDGVELRPAGYKILLEVTVRARPATVGNVGFNFGPRHAGRSKASLREGLVFLSHLARLVVAGRSRPGARPEPPAAVDMDAVDPDADDKDAVELRGRQVLEPVEKR
jgi:hypothetical protein